MKTLKISDEKARELYKTASPEFKSLLEENFGKEFFNYKIQDRVNDIESLCEFLGIDERELFIFSKNTKDKHERFINACNIIPKIVQVYNEGTILDWKNTSVYKYIPYKYFSSGSWLVVSVYWSFCLYGSTGFYYKSKELSESGYSNFQSIYEDYWNFNN